MDPIINKPKYNNHEQHLLNIRFVVPFIILTGCQSQTQDPPQADITNEIPSTAAIQEGFEIFDYVDDTSGDTILMQQYYMVILKSVENRSQSEKEFDSLQQLYLAHLDTIYRQGYTDISGPFDDTSDLYGVSISRGSVNPTHHEVWVE